MIISKIIKSGNLSMKQKFKCMFLYNHRVRGAQKSWKTRHKKVILANESYSEKCSDIVEAEHKKIWGVFRRKIDFTTLRICKNISGNSDPAFIPEDIYVSDIEPSLTVDKNVNYLSNKSFYNRWFQDGLFPKDFFHKIGGSYYDSSLNRSDYHKFQRESENFSYPLVLKPNRDTYGGEGIHFISNKTELIDIANNGNDFVIQEKIKQHPFFEKYSPGGLNTIRIYLYKSVMDERFHILCMALRMGKDGSLDNETAGGIHTMIRSNGHMNGYAVDKLGKKYEKHPNSNYCFDELIPEYELLEELALSIANQVFLARIVGLDACYDHSGRWRMIEVNTKGHAPRIAQYGGQPFFGEFTEEVIEYCKSQHWTLKE